VILEEFAMKWKSAVAFVTLLLTLSFVPSVSAGGWAAVALEEPVGEVAVGSETTVEFRVLAHNRVDAPMPGMETTFLFLQKETGFFVAASGEATSDPMVYTVTFTLEQAGDWELRAMIHNYLPDAPLLTTFPTVVATSDVETAGN
jgi:hypothetical protein